MSIDGQKLGIRRERLPPGHNAKPVQNGNQSPQYFRCAASVSDRADVHEMSPTDRLAEPMDKIHRPLGSDVPIFLKFLCHHCTTA